MLVAVRQNKAAFSMFHGILPITISCLVHKLFYKCYYCNRKNFVIAFALFFLPTFSLQAGNLIDSLKQLLRSDKEDSAKVIHLNKLSWAYQNIGMYDTAFYQVNTAFKLAKQINFRKGIADSYQNFGVIYDNQ